MADFKNRLHEQLARRTAREAFGLAGPEDDPVTVDCEPCQEHFVGNTEDALREALAAHYKTAAHRRATNITIERQRELRNS